MPPDLDKYIQAVLPGIDTIPDDRKEELRKLAAFVRAKTEAGAPAELLFICTHNSRRSQMGQIWAATAAAWYGVRGVRTFSGGTEATAFNPRAVAAMRRAGFQIDGPDGTNPHYRVTYTSDGPPLEAFSKKFVDPPNPQSDFAAVMTCGVADKACPIVHGAALRVPLHYEDPKDADGTPAEAATYDARARQIATEMFFLFAQVAQAGAPAH
jgi:protein-tyrosine-phosphatase